MRRRVVEDPSVGGQVAQPHHRPQRLDARAAGRRRRGPSAAGRRRRWCCVPTSIVSHSARSRWVSTRAAREETQRLVPSAAALRPSSVVANFQVTNGRPWSIANVHSRLTPARLVLEQAALDLDAGGAQGGRSPGGHRVGVALGEDHAAYAGLDQRPRARAGAAGVVARLEGDDGGRAASGRRPPGAARRPRRAASRRRGASPRRPCGPAASSSTQPTRGLGPVGTPGVAASASARRMAACSSVLVRQGVASGRVHGPRGVRRSLRTTSRSAQRNRPSCVFPSGL